MDANVNKATRVKQIFLDLNRKFEEQETQRQAARLGLPYFNLAGFPIEQAALSTINEEQAERVEAVPFFKEGPLLKIGVIDPKSQSFQKLLSSLKQEKYQPEIYLISQSAFRIALQQYRKILTTKPRLQHEVTVNVGVEVLQKLQNLPKNPEELASTSGSELVNLIMGSAVTMRSSDIHLEPTKKQFKVRFRIDGVLQDIIFLPISLYHLLLSRIKLLAGLKLNVTSVAQEGRFTAHLENKDLALRVSSLPSARGESVVMRILGIQEAGFRIEELGLQGRALKLIFQELRKTYGMVLTTGPTGSGKTTTLYAFLNHLNKPGIKIITLEDPVEYQLEGIIQTPINTEAGMDFAKGLRSILRQDPDIVMVGEIRDYDTAETASQAALTGHVVLSTLHTNDAAGAIPRLLDFGVKPVTLAPALNALIAQRLLRKICPHCKQIYQPNSEELQQIKHIISQIPPKSEIKVPAHLTFYHSPGCEKCHNIGYYGRVGAFEVFAVDEEIEQLIFKQVSSFEIKKAAIAAGMMTMQQDGILKALSGVTDLAEVWRVTEE